MNRRDALKTIASVPIAISHGSFWSTEDITPGPLAGFLKEKFPSVFQQPWSREQLKCLRDIESAAKPSRRFRVSLGHGAGSTVIAGHAALWAILSGQCDASMVIFENGEAAQAVLQSIFDSCGRNLFENGCAFNIGCSGSSLSFYNSMRMRLVDFTQRLPFFVLIDKGAQA